MKINPTLSVLFTFACFFICPGITSAQCSGSPNSGTASVFSPTVCVSSTGTANLNASGLSTGSGISYQWQVSAGGSFTNVSGGGGGTSPSFSTALFPVGTYSYQLITTCAFSALSNTSNIVIVYIRQTPTVSAVGTLTPGNNATIVATGGTAPYSYTWSPSVSSTSVATAISAGVHSVVVTDNGGCGATVLFNVSNPVNLWGITPFGGTSNWGVMYNCNPPLNTFTKTVDFVTPASGVEGRSIMQASNGKFYGMTSYGGTYSLGVLFEYDPVSLTYTKLLDFNGASNGAYPRGGLIQGTNGKLYGMATNGGTNNKGVLFEYDPAAGAYSKKIDFGSTGGEIPYGDLLEASNGKFYGLTSGGGATGYGALFEYDLALNTSTVMVNFNLFTSIGAGPNGSLIQAGNGKLYGLTSAGGALAGYGALFEYDITSNTCLAKVSFTGTNGESGTGSLVQAGNTKLYGFTSDGGVNDDGVMFEYDPATAGYVKKIDFNKTNTLGNIPIYLKYASNGNLYGLTFGGVNYQGLLNDQGTLFEYNVAASMLFKKIDFNGSGNGGIPVRILETLPPCSYSLTSSAGNSPVCAGTHVTLTVNGITSFSWSTGATTKSIVISPTVSTSYLVTGSAPTCLTPGAAGIAMVSVSALPNVITNDVIICPGNTATVMVSGASNYSWSTGASTSSITVSPATTTNYTITGYSAQGCSKTETVSVTVFTTPTVLVNSPTICAGQTATVSASGLETYTWNTSATTSVIAVSPTSTTIYTLSGSICSVAVSTTAQVWVNSLPTVAVTSTTICSNQTATLTPSGASSFSVNGVANTSFTFNPASSTTYSVSGSSNNCLSANIALASVSVNIAPVISVSHTTICSGQTATVTPLGALSFSVNGVAQSTFTYSPANTTTYIYTGSDNTCVSNSVAVTVSVNATPGVSVTSATICSGQTATLVPGGASSYSVNGSAITNFTFNPANTSTYAVTGSSNNCVSTQVITTVSVNARPIVSVNNVSVCSGQVVTLTPGGASTYSVNTVASTTFTFNAVNTTYAITGTSNNCVSSNTAYATVSVTPIPWIYISDPIICAGQTAILTPYGADSYSVNGVANSTFTFNPATTSTYAVTGSSNTCVSSNTAVATIIVNPLPTISVNSSVICSGQSATIVATGADFYTITGGQWQVTPNATTHYSISGTYSTGCTSANEAIVTISVNLSPSISVNNSVICSGQSAVLIPSGASTYTVSGGQWTVSPNTTTSYNISGTGQNGCASTNTAVATVSINTTPVISANNVTLCSGQSATIIPAGALTYTIAGGSFILSPNATTVYGISGTDGNGCISSGTTLVQVVVNALPNLSTLNSTICTGEPATLTASGAATYTWLPGNVSPSATVYPVATTSYTVRATDNNNCENTAVTIVFVENCSGLILLNKESSGLTIFPNPNNGRFTVACESGLEIIVTDMMGRMIYTHISNALQTEISLTHFDKGVYFVGVGQKRTKILIE